MEKKAIKNNFGQKIMKAGNEATFTKRIAQNSFDRLSGFFNSVVTWNQLWLSTRLFRSARGNILSHFTPSNRLPMLSRPAGFSGIYNPNGVFYRLPVKQSYLPSSIKTNLITTVETVVLNQIFPNSRVDRRALS